MPIGPFDEIPVTRPPQKVRLEDINELRRALTNIQDAYDVAVANGFVGTRANWLASLVGPPGAGVVPKGSVATIAERDAIVNPQVDDVWTVDETGHAYAWRGGAWVDIGRFRGPGGMDTELRARTDPETAGTLGRALRWGPSGKTAWGERVISADWYSNLNDAITAAGQGGTVRLSERTTYTDTSGDPILVVPGLTIEGDRDTSRINTAGPGLAVKTPASICDRVTLRNFGLVGGGIGNVGLDARGLTRSLIEGVDVAGFTDAEVWFGGDNPAYYASWTNEMRGGEITAPTNGAGIRFSGKTAGGAVTANNITLAKCVVFVADSPTSIGVDLAEGDTNLLLHNDVGYSMGGGIPFRFGAGAQHNTLLRNRTEDIDVAVRTVSGAAYNSLIANTFGTRSTTLKPVELVSGTQWFLMVGNAYSATAPSPKVDVQTGATNHRVMDASADYEVRPIQITAAGGDAAAQFKVKGNSQNSFSILTSGGLYWTNGTTGAATLLLYQKGTGILGTDDNRFWQIPKHASLPTASATYRGSMIRLEGATGVADGLYWCRKKADDAYEWALIS